MWQTPKADSSPRAAGSGEELTIRLARPGDEPALRRVAALDSRRAPRGDVLVAEVGGEVRAALSLAGEEPVADPFAPTAALTSLLRLRAIQLRGEGGHAGPATPRRLRLVPLPSR
jgi:hypothetical protein